MRWIVKILAALAVLSGSELRADAIEEKNLVSGKSKLDPAQGYILVSVPSRYQGVFVRIPDADDWASYRADWEKGFAKAQKDFPGKVKSWQDKADYAVKAGQKVPPKPNEPKAETFSIGPIEPRLITGFGPQFVFQKDKAVPIYRYLTSVKAGTYIWYGPMFYAANGAMGGYCNCMGSVKFEVKVGVITDLGDFLLTVARRDGLIGFDKIDDAADVFSASSDGQGEIRPEAATYGVPASLQVLPSVRAEFSASGKIDNFYNAMVNRVRPIPGILGYRRDDVIDLRTGQVIKVQIAPFDPNAPADDSEDGQ